MSKLYIYIISKHTSGAKNKGTICPVGDHDQRREVANVKCVVAADADAAYKQVAASFKPADPRPIAGKSYLKPSKEWGHLQETPEWLPYIGYVIGYYSDVLTRNDLLAATADATYQFRPLPAEISQLIRDMR